jgi:hypothetical protein
MGSDSYEITHIDALDKEGMIFTDVYSSAVNRGVARGITVGAS